MELEYKIKEIVCKWCDDKLTIQQEDGRIELELGDMISLFVVLRDIMEKVSLKK